MATKYRTDFSGPKKRPDPVVDVCDHLGCYNLGILGFGPPLEPRELWFCCMDHVPDRLRTKQ